MVHGAPGSSGGGWDYSALPRRSNERETLSESDVYHTVYDQPEGGPEATTSAAALEEGAKKLYETRKNDSVRAP